MAELIVIAAAAYIIIAAIIYIVLRTFADDLRKEDCIDFSITSMFWPIPTIVIVVLTFMLLFGNRRNY